ncbi:MAG TPA: energy transducer TonB [Candidatus Deferrimicrobium sp.]|nr:energy transducer TonB [Candidatus Deferrimicrobium sp.]
MSEYKVVNNYLVFEELNSDPLGINYRAGEIENRKASKHRLLTEVYPFIAGNPDTWKRVNILMEGIKKSNIPNLYAPEKIIKEEGNPKALLIYPLIKGRTFEKVLEDSMEKDLPINFDLTFSIAIAIADLIDTGSSIVVSGQKSFHGFLTPDNILFDYDGKIYLKNYGIFPYLNKTEELFNEMVSKYGAWVAPEFLRKEKLVPQSDIYHLGYIIYRILTGEYFSYSEGEDFNAKFANIRFIQQLPSGDIDFITNLISFFKQTLNPDPNKRFVNMKEFKDYIAQYFHIEELSSVTFNLAYFMNSLYMETMDEEADRLKKELAYTLPEPKKDAAAESHLAESILAGLEEQKSSKLKVMIPLIIVIIIVAIVAVFFISQAQKASREKQQQLQTIKDMESRLAQFQKQQEDAQKQYQEQLKSLEAKKTTTDEEQKAKEEEIKKLKEYRQQQEQKEQERIKAEKEALAKQQALDEQRKKELEAELKSKQEEEEKKKSEEAAKKLQDESNKIIEGQVIPLSEADEQPVRIKGADPVLPTFVREKYKRSKEISILTNIQIDEKGSVINVRVLGTPPEDLANIITKTLKKWQYQPAKKDNVKVKVWVPVSFKFTF